MYFQLHPSSTIEETSSEKNAASSENDETFKEIDSTLAEFDYPDESYAVEDNHEVPAESKRPLEHFNEFLQACDQKPVSEMTIPWEQTSNRSRRRHLQQARESVLAVLHTLAPHSVGQLWKALVSSGLRDEQSADAPELSDLDRELMEALSECYLNAKEWSTRRQILSIMADKLQFKELKHFLPEVTLYRFKIARQHQILHGRGVPVPVQQQFRMQVDPQRLDHFINFITSSNVIQDIPFGEKIMKLRTGETLYAPNVIRNMIPSTIIKQYIAYCKETSFPHLSERSLRRILEVCPASVRQSLQGLDYFTANGKPIILKLKF